MNEESIHSWILVRHQHLPPHVERHFHRLAAESFDCGELCRGRMIWNDDSAGHTDAPRAPRYSLRHVACTCGVDAFRKLLRGRDRHRVACASQLERADRLQVLELEINLGGCTIDIQSHERRAHCNSLQSFPCRLNLSKRHGFTSLHRSCCRLQTRARLARNFTAVGRPVCRPGTRRPVAFDEVGIF